MFLLDTMVAWRDIENCIVARSIKDLLYGINSTEKKDLRICFFFRAMYVCAETLHPYKMTKLQGYFTFHIILLNILTKVGVLT